MTPRFERILFLAFEHEAMHLETILYMLVQSKKTIATSGLSLTMNSFLSSSSLLCNNQELPPPAVMATVDGATFPFGINDDEKDDFNTTKTSSSSSSSSTTLKSCFGWDNEKPQRMVTVSSFKMQHRPVTNQEYFQFLKSKIDTSDYESYVPAAWGEFPDGCFGVKTIFGLIPFSISGLWPVSVSYDLAHAYAESKGLRLPTEFEWMAARHQFVDNKSLKSSNFGFSSWHPQNVLLSCDTNNNHSSSSGSSTVSSSTQSPMITSLVGDGWELTSSDFDSYEGFQSSELYPGYSSDFFDHKHKVVLGGSWATHPRIALRHSFRNWYQTGYPFVFSKFRCVSDS